MYPNLLDEITGLTGCRLDGEDCGAFPAKAIIEAAQLEGQFTRVVAFRSRRQGCLDWGDMRKARCLLVLRQVDTSQSSSSSHADQAIYAFRSSRTVDQERLLSMRRTDWGESQELYT